MEVRSFNNELAIANLCFKKIFNNIQIERTKNNGIIDIINVSCQLGQRSRILKNWENSEKRANIKLPMIIINRTGYNRSSERLNDYNNEIKYEISNNNRKYDILTPVPIDINYDVSIIAKYPSDIDQIASNFMVFFNNDVYIPCMHPKYEGIKLNNQIVMSDSITEEHQDELDGSTDDIITSTFQFTFKTYLFGGTQKTKLVQKEILSTYISTYNKYEITEISPNKIDEFQKTNPNTPVSAYIWKEVTESITTPVPNPTLSDTIYDGFIPIIQQLNVGYYPVPQESSYVEYINEIDNYPLSVQPYYVDRFVWKIKEN